MKKKFVLDTNILLFDAESIFEFEDNDIILSIGVLEELDSLKNNQGAVGFKARRIIRSLEELRKKGFLQDGVSLKENLGNLRITAAWRNLSNSVDDEIINVALNENAILISNDINVRVKASAQGVEAREYSKETSEQALYTGAVELYVDEELIDDFYEKKPIVLPETYYSNQFITLKSKQSKRSAIARYQSPGEPIKKLSEFKGKTNSVQRLKLRNREQIFAMNLLMNPDIPLVTLSGKAGTGKTLMALAAGLEQVLNDKQYGKILISKPVIPMGKDIGYLPGSVTDKMDSWIAPFRDNLEFLSQLNNDPSMGRYLDSDIIEIEALTYMRGRSLTNAFIILDEIQNTTRHEIKTLLTRVGEGSKLVLLGDIYQIDNPAVDMITNGLTTIIEKFKEHSLAGHVTLMSGERSDIASLAAEIL